MSWNQSPSFNPYPQSGRHSRNSQSNLNPQEAWGGDSSMLPDPSEFSSNASGPTFSSDSPSVTQALQELKDQFTGVQADNNRIISSLKDSLDGLTLFLQSNFPGPANSSQPPPVPPVLPVVNVTAPHSGPTPKFRDPRTFDGKVASVTPFLGEITSAIYLQGNALVSDRHKAIYFSLYLKDGSPKSWYYSIEQDLSKKHLLDNFTAFLADFKKHFGDSNRHGTALAAMGKLTQTGSCASFASRFRELLVDLQYTEQTKIDTFRDKVKPHVKDALALRDNVPTNFDKFVELCITLDNNAHERQQQRKAEGKPSSSSSHSNSRSRFVPNPSYYQPAATTAPTAPTASSSSSDVVPMEIDAIRRGPLTAEEKQRRREQGLCLYCGQGQHTVANCPNMSERAKRNQKAKPTSGKA